MNKRSSDGSYERLMRQAIATGRAGTHTGRGNTASSDNALSFMGWANALADREEEADKVHSPTVGGGFRPMGISGKGRGAKAPPVAQEVGEIRAKTDLERACRGGSFSGFNVATELVVHTNPNMAGMAMRRPTKRKTSAGFLMVIDGVNC